MAEPHVLHWNGKDLPPELRQLQPGEYIIEPLIAGTFALSDEEDAAIQAGLDAADRGKTIPASEVFARIDAILHKK